MIDVQAQDIRHKDNYVRNDFVPNIAADEKISTNIVLNNETSSFISSSDSEKTETKRALLEAEVIAIRNAKIALKIGGDVESDSSFEMAESHIFRPLFRYRVRKSSNVRS